MSCRGLRRLLGVGLFALLLLVLAMPAAARPGGGESFSGGSSGGGDGDGASGCIFLLLRLWIEFVFAYPAIGIPLTIVGVLAFVAWQKKRGRKAFQGWDTAPARTTPPPPPRPPVRDLEALRAADPRFSAVLFEDFAYALFARAHQARSDPRALEALAPYLGEAARGHLAGRPPVGAPVSAVVVGALRVLDVSLPASPAAPEAPQDNRSVVTLEIEANLTGGAPESPDSRTDYVRERWRLTRAAGVLTKPPEQITSFHCPNCGAPFTSAAGGGRCDYCGQVVTDGRFDWSVESIELLRLEERPPALTQTVEEVGTSWPTVFHPQLATRRAELLRDDPAATDQALGERLRLIYQELNTAWTALDLKRVRPYVSESLYEYLQFWTEAYRRQGLRNVLEGMRVVDLALVKVTRDATYDAVTFRVWGSGRDATVREATGDVVVGDRKKDRVYSEYWTLIRGTGVRGAPRTDPTCPSCGAPLAVNRAGECEHCGAAVASGRFDWVLSKIEQDDVYV